MKIYREKKIFLVLYLSFFSCLFMFMYDFIGERIVWINLTEIFHSKIINYVHICVVLYAHSRAHNTMIPPSTNHILLSTLEHDHASFLFVYILFFFNNSFIHLYFTQWNKNWRIKYEFILIEECSVVKGNWEEFRRILHGWSIIVITKNYFRNRRN